MTRHVRHVLALVLMLTSTSALAMEQWVKARAKLNSCGYFNSAEVEVNLTYRNALPWGSSVYLVYGWSGWSGSGFTWANTQTVEAPAVSDWTWGITVSSVFRARSSTVYDSINYVWKVVLPDGSEFYEKGNSSTLGYYAANFSALPVPCTSDGSYVSNFEPLTITTVEKW